MSPKFPYEHPQAIEVNPKGEIVWSWSAKKEYRDCKYKDVRSKDGNDWTHLNSVQRLPDCRVSHPIRLTSHDV